LWGQSIGSNPMARGQIIMKLNCFNKKGQHVGPLVELFNFGGIDAERVLRWCPKCGAVVVDLDVDGKTISGGVVKMKISQITEDIKKIRKCG